MSKKDWGIEDPQDTYWYNTRSGAVEEGPQSLSMDRLGPFGTREEAERAPETVSYTHLDVYKRQPRSCARIVR